MPFSMQSVIPKEEQVTAWSKLKFQKPENSARKEAVFWSTTAAEIASTLRQAAAATPRPTFTPRTTARTGSPPNTARTVSERTGPLLTDRTAVSVAMSTGSDVDSTPIPPPWTQPEWDAKLIKLVGKNKSGQSPGSSAGKDGVVGTTGRTGNSQPRKDGGQTENSPSAGNGSASVSSVKNKAGSLAPQTGQGASGLSPTLGPQGRGERPSVLGGQSQGESLASSELLKRGERSPTLGLQNRAESSKSSAPGTQNKDDGASASPASQDRERASPAPRGRGVFTGGRGETSPTRGSLGKDGQPSALKEQNQEQRPSSILGLLGLEDRLPTRGSQGRAQGSASPEARDKADGDSSSKQGKVKHLPTQSPQDEGETPPLVQNQQNVRERLSDSGLRGVRERSPTLAQRDSAARSPSPTVKVEAKEGRVSPGPKGMRGGSSAHSPSKTQGKTSKYADSDSDDDTPPASKAASKPNPLRARGQSSPPKAQDKKSTYVDSDSDDMAPPARKPNKPQGKAENALSRGNDKKSKYVDSDSDDNTPPVRKAAGNTIAAQDRAASPIGNNPKSRLGEGRRDAQDSKDIRKSPVASKRGDTDDASSKLEPEGTGAAKRADGNGAKDGEGADEDEDERIKKLRGSMSRFNKTFGLFGQVLTKEAKTRGFSEHAE
jgi:hypothetical protein